MEFPQHQREIKLDITAFFVDKTPDFKMKSSSFEGN